ncbi:MAG: acyl-CoA dehydrogenase family protein [Betaproteobacteria bacterium]
MDFDFSDDQLQLREAVARWVEKAYTFERRRGIEAAGGFSREIWGELAELGLTGLAVPEDQGGMGMGPVEAMVVMEELGRGLVLEPLGQALICGRLLSQLAPQSPWLAKLAAGQAVLSLAWQERGGRYRAAHCQTQAEGERLSGTKSLVAAGDQADAFIVSARRGGLIALYLVEADAAGLSRHGYGAQDGSRAAELHLKDTPAQLLAADGLAALEEALDMGAACACAEGVGAMDKSLAITADYMNQRKQFGVAIASFQALRHRLADMKMQLELSRSMSYYAWLKLLAPAQERAQAVARAKVQLGQSMRFVGQQSVQLHGGIGVTDEYIISHYFKKLTALELSFGDTLHHLGQVSERMQETAGVFA